MAMRPQGVPLQFTVGPTYEDFEPKFAENEEPTSYVLHVYLPGFAREQLKVTYVESAKKIRARGERPLGDYRWSRFQKEFSIPDDCIGSQIRGKFEGNVLMITMQKKVTAQESPTPPKVDKPAESKPQKGPQDSPQKLTSSGDLGNKGDKSTSPKKATVESKPEKGKQDSTQKPTSAADNKTTSPPQKVQDQSPTKQQHGSVTQKAMEEEKDSSKKSKEAEMAECEAKKKMEQNDGYPQTGDQEKPEMSRAKKSNQVQDVVAYAKEVMGKLPKRLKEDEGSKSSLMNAGVAAMVIVAMGTYIAYTIGSGDFNN